MGFSFFFFLFIFDLFLCISYVYNYPFFTDLCIFLKGKLGDAVYVSLISPFPPPTFFLIFYVMYLKKENCGFMYFEEKTWDLCILRKKTGRCRI